MKTIGQPAKNPLRISIYWTVICFAMICLLATNVMAQTLGNYPNKTIAAGLNTTVVPAAAPAGASSVVAYTHTNFSGQLTVNPTTGVVYITNAKQAGTYTVTVKAFGAGTVTKTFTLTVSNPICSQGSLGDSTMIAPSGALGAHNPLSIADLNNDGKQDWVTISGSVKLGDGKGGFTDGPGFGFPAGSSFNAITIGDLNGDGRQDVVGYYFSNASAQPAIFIRLGDGAGGFTEVPELIMPGQLNAIALGDFNTDGRLDIAAGDASTGLVYIRLGNGTGGFTGSTQVSVSGPMQAIAIGDFNKDGKQDWVTSTGSVRLGDGLGGFNGNTELSIANSWSGLAMADFNGDGNQDLAFGNYPGTSVPIRLGDGNGGFTAAADVPVSLTNAGYALAGDFNGDGKTDIAVSSIGSLNPKSIAFKLGNGAGGFTDGVILTSAFSGFQRMLAMGDFNGDGRHDLAAVGSSQIALYFGLKPMLVKGDNQMITDGDNTPAPADFTDFGTVNPGASLSRSFTITNNRTDNLLISSITSSNARFVVSGAPTMVAPGTTAGFTVRFSPIAAGTQNAVITINNNDPCGESVFDFTVTGKTSGFNYTNTTITAGLNSSITPTGFPANAVSAVAITNTSFTGLIIAEPDGGLLRITNAKNAGVYNVTVHPFDENGEVLAPSTFTLTVSNPLCSQGNLGDSSMRTFTTTGVHNPLAIADLNNDGKQDWVNTDGRVKLGDGKGGFTDGTGFVISGSSITSIAIGDLNGDGRQDVVGYYFSNSSVQPAIFIRLGDGTGGFTEVPELTMPGQLYAISLGDFNTDGRLDIAAGDASTGLVYIRLGNGTGGFAGNNQVSVSGPTQAIAIGDFNKDGKQDWVTSGGSVRLGDGLGGFSGSTELTIANSWSGLAMADFNGDGNQDLAFGNTSTSVPIRLGDGNGGFTAAADLPFTLVNVGYALAGDFNGDGKTDLAVSSIGSLNPKSISIKLGNGAGGFTDGVILTSAFSGFQRMVAMGDFNGDGLHDLAAVGTGQIALYFGLKPMLVKGDNQLIADGDNTPSPVDFTDFGTVNTGASFSRTFTITNNRTDNLIINSIASSNARFVVSGAPTIVAPGTTAGFVVRFSPNAVGTQNAVITINNNDPCGEAIFDFTVTGKTSGFNYTNTTIIAGLNTSITPTGFPINAISAVAMAGTSFSGSFTLVPEGGLLRIINAKQAGNYSVTVQPYANNGALLAPSTFSLTVTNPLCSQGQFSNVANVGVDAYCRAIVIGDFNGDNIQDFATTHPQVKKVNIRLGNGLGGFTAGNALSFSTNPFALAMGDFNRDGNQDLAISNSGSTEVSIRLGDGLGGFSGNTQVIVGTSPQSIAIADFNGDGNEDLATANYTSKDVSIRLGNGLGGFADTTNIAVSNNPQSLAIGDFNGDGKRDIAVCNFGTNDVNILLGNGSGGFTMGTNVTVGTNPQSIAIGDFNGDGKQDFATANYFANTVSIRLGDGLGGFTGNTNVGVGSLPWTVAIGDFDGDGRQDIATTNYAGDNVSIRLGDGAGGFIGNTQVSLESYSSPMGLSIGDFNGDGNQDLAIANNSGNTVSIRLGGKPTINTWLGTTSSDWNNPSNWSLGMVPNACTSAQVNAGAPNMPVVSGINTSIPRIIISAGGSVIVQPGAKLNITGKMPPP